MAKHEDNAVIALLIFVILILFVIFGYLLLRLMTVDAALYHQQREMNKAVILLNETRQKLKAELKQKEGEDE
jgi:uncharacterized membrane-anchored protein YhcB (DUF1043 family)